MTARFLAALCAALLALPAAVLAAPSPKIGSFELGTGKYLPDIDSEFSGDVHPYKDAFGEGGGWTIRAGLSFAVHSSTAGVAEVGVRSGWFRDSGHGLFEPTTGTFVPSGDKTTFNVIPSSLILTYRFDGVPERTVIPLAPYVRLGLERYNWWVTDGDGGTAKKGATNGWSATGGVAFLLDVLDRQDARDLDRESGINHTYIFADFTYDKVDDFGSKKSWDLSNKKPAFQFGLMFAF